jgi:hypothetical protein
MKKVAFLLLTFTFLFIAPPVQAATPVVRITDIPHTDFQGNFRDNKLALSLTSDGKLGKALNRVSKTTTWVIDAALLDEIIDMSDGYQYLGKEDPIGATVALLWLQQLKTSTEGAPIVALPYGNPDASLARSLSRSELALYSELGRSKLEEFFGRAVISQNGWGEGKSQLNSEFKALYKENRSQLANLARVVSAEEIPLLRGRLGRLLNPDLNAQERAYFSYQGRDATNNIVKKLRVVSGRYQLTSETVKVPLTIINDFETDTVLTLSLLPMNYRIQVESVYDIVIPAKSRIQISVPFMVIASGTTVVEAQLMTSEGVSIGDLSILSLSMTVIDSRVAWFTTGAGVLLFLAAATQTARRIRRSRREK